MTYYKPDHAFILAAGKGTRLRPYTNTVPKPLVPINGRPILEHMLDKLKKSDIKNVVINTNYLGDRINNFVTSYTGLNISISSEDKLLNTGGGVKFAMDKLNGEPFFLINGDAFWVDKTPCAFERLAQAWDPQKMDVLLLLQPVANMVLTKGIGDYDLKADGQAVRSIDKTGEYMFGGIRITKTQPIINHPDEIFSFLEIMDEAQEKGRLYGLVHDGEWHHISTPQDLETVNDSLASPDKTIKHA